MCNRLVRCAGSDFVSFFVSLYFSSLFVVQNEIEIPETCPTDLRRHSTGNSGFGLGLGLRFGFGLVCFGFPTKMSWMELQLELESSRVAFGAKCQDGSIDGWRAAACRPWKHLSLRLSCPCSPSCIIYGISLLIWTLMRVCRLCIALYYDYRQTGFRCAEGKRVKLAGKRVRPSCKEGKWNWEKGLMGLA